MDKYKLLGNCHQGNTITGQQFPVFETCTDAGETFFFNYKTSVHKICLAFNNSMLLIAQNEDPNVTFNTEFLIVAVLFYHILIISFQQLSRLYMTVQKSVCEATQWPIRLDLIPVSVTSEFGQDKSRCFPPLSWNREQFLENNTGIITFDAFLLNFFITPSVRIQCSPKICNIICKNQIFVQRM